MLSRRMFVTGGGMVLAGALSGVLAGCGQSGRTLVKVTDMGGTEVSVPNELRKTFCTNPIGTVDLYCLAPDLLAGWNFKPYGLAQSYIPEAYLELPSLGVWMGAGNTPNPEEIAQQDPDVLLCFWTADDNGRAMVEEVTRETAMPTLLVDYRLQSAPETFRFLGALFGREERAEELAAYCEEKIAYIADVVAGIPQDERKSIYLAQSSGGLSTDPVGSMHVDDALELCGVRNVADLPGTVGQGMGMPTVNIEQVAQWNPDAVLVSEYTMSDYRISDLYGEIRDSAEWRHVAAVKEGRVYSIPQAPFSWFGRPPSVVRLLGCLQLLKLLYPAHVEELDVREEARAFYDLFLNAELTDTKLDELLQNAGV